MGVSIADLSRIYGYTQEEVQNALSPSMVEQIKRGKTREESWS
jgi:hypothetical protein